MLLFGFSQESHASDVTVELGAGFLSGEFSKGGALLVNQRWKSGRYSVGIGYISEQEVTDRSNTFYEVRENLFIQAQRRTCLFNDKLCLGIGVAHFNNTNRALGSKFTAGVHVEGQINENLSLNIRHYSNAGSATPNMGQDMITIGWSF